MKRLLYILIFTSAGFCSQGFVQAQDAEAYLDLLDVIRNEKFDYVLPKAMRNNNVDMWIQVMGTKNGEEGNLDPLRLDLGTNTGIVIFSDRGGDRIERAILGRASSVARECGAYDLFARESELTSFVAERDPKRIGVNFSDKIAVCDGISYTDCLKLTKALGEKYSSRIVSAEDVINDFRTERVISEIVFFGELCKETLDVIDEAFDLVRPGETTVLDIGKWLVNENMKAGYDAMFQFLIPGVFIQDRDGNENDARGGDGNVIKRGDLVHIDFGTIHMNYRTDIKRLGYVVKEGETELPPEIKKALDEGLRARKIFHDNIKLGRTAGETFDILKLKLEEAGFYYNTKEGFDLDADPGKTQIWLGFHPLGNSWPADGVGPTIQMNSETADMLIPRNHLFVLEYNIQLPVPEWGKGKHVYMALEDDAIVTERGVEYLYPPMKEIRLIH